MAIQFRLIQKRMEENGIKIEANREVLDHLGKIGFDPTYGARPLKRVIQREILNQLSKEILAGKVNKDDVIGITMSDGKAGGKGIEFINLNEVNIEQ